MFHINFVKTTIITIVLSFSFIISYAQPTGATFSNPILVGQLIPSVPYNSSINNSAVNGYQDNIGNPNDDIYYKFSLLDSSEVSISHCGSGFDTYVMLLNSNGTLLASNDDDGPLCSYFYDASLKATLGPGVYYVVSEGWASYTGTIKTSISIPGSVTVNTGFATQMGQAFGVLEKHRVPYGLLRDVAFEQINLSNYEGASLVDSNFVSVSEFTSIYQTLVSAKVNSTAPSFTPISEINTASFALRQPGKVILTGLLYKYSKFADNAVQANKIQIVNNQVKDKYVNSVWQDPYEVKTAFAIAPTGINYKGKSQQFMLPASLSKGNVTGAVTGLQFDAGDGLGYRTMAYDQIITVNYPTIGNKELKFKMTLNTGAILYSHSMINISASLAETYLSNTPVAYPITSTELYNGKAAQGTMIIKYKGTNTTLTKPLIVVEGFDMGRVTMPEAPYGEYDLAKFESNLPSQSQLKDIVLPDYDIVFVNWKDGTDDIKRLALLLKDVIRYVNTNKTGTEKNVVLGMSMGGLVARWALKDMEDHAEDHKTKLYISYDTPHQGANLPLGFQYLVNHARKLYTQGAVEAIADFISSANDNPWLSSYLSIPNTPAARQMLITYLNNNNQIDNSVHDAWQNELKSKGYPNGFTGKPLRKIAISNGSECATTQLSAPNSELISYYGKAGTKFLPELGSMVVTYFSPGTSFSIYGSLAALSGEPSFLLGMLPGKTELKGELKVNAVAEGGGNRVYHGKMTYTKKLLWLINITTTLTDENGYAPAGMRAYDSYPGGVGDLTVNLQDAEYENDFIKYSAQASSQRYFGFIPVTSALDIGSGNATLSQADYTKKYIGSSPPVAPKNSPFANFVTAAVGSALENQIHISVDQRTSNWLSQELLGVTGAATRCYPCSTASIIGPDQFCTSGTYTLEGLPSNATVEWQAGTWATLSSTTGLTTTVTRSSWFGGYAGLVAKVTYPCSELSTPIIANIVKTVNMGPPASNIPMCTTGGISYPLQSTTCLKLNAAYPNMYSGEIVVNDPTAITTSWTLVSKSPSSAIVQILSHANNTWVINIRPNGASAVIDFTRTNACGSKTQRYTFIANGPCPPPLESIVISNPEEEESALSVYPNPASSDFTVGFSNQLRTADSDGNNFEIKLYNSEGTVLRSASNQGMGNLTVSTTDIPSGTYYLHVKRGKKTIKKQVLIQH